MPTKRESGKTPTKTRRKRPTATPPEAPIDLSAPSLALIKPRPHKGGMARRDVVAPRERALKALALYKLGMNYEQIAREVGYSTRGNAWRAINQLLASYEIDGVNEARQVVGERLMDLYRVLIPRALQGDLPAIDRVLQIHDRYTRLFGLNAQPAPEQGEGGQISITILPRPDSPRVVNAVESEPAQEQTHGGKATKTLILE